MTYEEIMERLKCKRPGSYMFRMSATNMGNWAIGYIASDGKAYQTIPKNKSMIEALVEGVRGRFYLYPGRFFILDEFRRLTQNFELCVT